MAEFDRARNRYFRWLLKQIDYETVKEEHADYSYLLKALFDRDFYWDVPHDDNRAADGTQLRFEANMVYDFGKCSMLEMMIALAKRIDKEILPDFNHGDNPAKWFWEMIDNCGASKYDNQHWDAEAVNYILSLIMFRGYGRDGKGGFFPLKNATKDQRKVEIWYQMQAYIMENYEI